MKKSGPRLEAVIGIAAACAIICGLSIVFGFPIQVIFSLCLTAMIALIWMTIRILKDPFTTTKTFDEFFYQDREDI